MPAWPAVTHSHQLLNIQRRIRALCSADVPAMVPTMVKLSGQSRSMVQLLPPPSDPNNPLTAVELARSAEVSEGPLLCQCHGIVVATYYCIVLKIATDSSQRLKMQPCQQDASICSDKMAVELAYQVCCAAPVLS